MCWQPAANNSGMLFFYAGVMECRKPRQREQQPVSRDEVISKTVAFTLESQRGGGGSEMSAVLWTGRHADVVTSMSCG